MKLARFFRKSRVQHIMSYFAGFLVWLALVAWLPGKGGSIVCLLGLGIMFYAYCRWAQDPTGTPPRDFPFCPPASFQFKFDARTTYLLAKAEQQRTLLRSSQKSAENGDELVRVAQETATDSQKLLRSK